MGSTLDNTGNEKTKAILKFIVIVFGKNVNLQVIYYMGK